MDTLMWIGITIVILLIYMAVKLAEIADELWKIRTKDRSLKEVIEDLPPHLRKITEDK